MLERGTEERLKRWLSYSVLAALEEAAFTSRHSYDGSQLEFQGPRHSGLHEHQSFMQYTDIYEGRTLIHIK